MNAAELQVAVGSLRGIAEEMGMALIHSALSPNIKERRDCSTALFDPEGRLVIQAEHIPVHLGALPASVAAVRPGAEVRLSATGDAERSRRTIHWDGEEIEATVLTGSGLPPGTSIEGPAVIEFPETTCLVPPGWSGGADEHGIVRLHT